MQGLWYILVVLVEPVACVLCSLISLGQSAACRPALQIDCLRSACEPACLSTSRQRAKAKPKSTVEFRCRAGSGWMWPTAEHDG